MSSQKKIRVNHQIRTPKVRVIGPDGEQIGVLGTKDAIQAAEEHDLDLVEVSPKADPPVCRIMDYGKYLYQEKKKLQEAKKKHKVYEIKEVKFRPRIDTHDYETKMKRLVGFLADGDKVKVTVQMRGREMARMDLAYTLLSRVAEDVGEQGVVESGPDRAGNRIHQVIAPSRKKH